MKVVVSVLIFLCSSVQLYAQPTVAVLRGELAHDRLGSEKTFQVPDLNADGISDLLTSSPLGQSSTDSETDVGLIKAISGASGETIYNVEGDFNQDRLGEDGIFFPGDLNNDKVPDYVAVSAAGDSRARIGDDAGVVKAIDGVTGKTIYNVYGNFAGDGIGSGGPFLPGDLNKDNVPDLVVVGVFAESFLGGSNNVGIVKAINGATGEVLYDVRGDFTGDVLGAQGLFLPGDLNSDGISDLVAVSSGADSRDGAHDNVGLVKAISGADGAVLYNVRGDFSRDSLGDQGLFLPGDLNNDGVPDLLAASQRAKSLINNSVGVVKAISGATGKTLYNFYGNFQGDFLSSTGVFLPGDLNNDGVADIVASSAIADSEASRGNSVGLVKAFSGATGEVLFNVKGDFSFDALSQGGVFLPGDLNNDNIPEIIAVAQFGDSFQSARDSVGNIKVINGATGEILHDIRGEFDDKIGRDGVFFPGDINNDGFPEIVAASSAANSSFFDNDSVGLVRVIDGKSGETLYDLRGDFPEDQLGFDGVFIPGDLNQDSFADLILVSSQADSASGAEDDVGIVRVISGATGSILYDIKGEFSDDQLGLNGILLPGDINNDGNPDFVINSKFADSSEGAADNVGAVIAIDGTTGNVIYNIKGDFTGDLLSGTLALALDVNGDTVTDIVAGSTAASSAEDVRDSVGIIKIIYSESKIDDSVPETNDPENNNPQNNEPENNEPENNEPENNEPEIGGPGIVIPTDIDQCPSDPLKTDAGFCGCGIVDGDANANGLIDCLPEDQIFELTIRIRKRVNRVQIDTPARNIFGTGRLVRLVKTLGNSELEALALELRTVARRINRRQTNQNLNTRRLRRFKRSIRRTILELQSALVASTN